ncbi:hypothetical protein ACSR0Z_29585 [Streptomyces viridosporus]
MTTQRASPRPAPVHALAGIRFFNGTTGPPAPALLIRRLVPGGVALGPAAVYAFRLFGIRTLLLGLDLLTNHGERLRGDLRESFLIHGSNTATAVTLGLNGRLPPRTGVSTTPISIVNTVLATTSLANSANLQVPPGADRFRPVRLRRPLRLPGRLPWLLARPDPPRGPLHVGHLQEPHPQHRGSGVVALRRPP